MTMKSTAVLVSIALLAASASTALLASDRDDDHDRDRDRATAQLSDVSGYDHGMQAVSNQASAGERAHGWRYFTDPTTYRAVVISPQGDYYLSRGRGLRWVAGAQTSA
jgi:hypothetical protein